MVDVAPQYSADASSSESGWITITLCHRKTIYNLELPDDASVPDLFEEIATALDIPISNQKILVPKGPLLKSPFNDTSLSLRSLQGKTLTLMGSGAAEVQAVQNMTEKVAQRNAARIAQKAQMKRINKSRRSIASSAEDAKYTFLQVQPLQGLPHPERSQQLLMRLKEDPGIRAVMKQLKLTVSLLTEMEPLSYTETTHEGTSRTLGLNRNQGEVIELRLRTDAHDGYRDYKTVRKTLCHELTHNLRGPHDQKFWDLCHRIERIVDAADWKTSGHTIGETSRYTRMGQTDTAEEEHEDDGGWTGGEFVLGGMKGEGDGMSRREILAQAALERQKREDAAERMACDAAEQGWRPCQRPPQHPGDKRE